MQRVNIVRINIFMLQSNNSNRIHIQRLRVRRLEPALDRLICRKASLTGDSEVGRAVASLS